MVTVGLFTNIRGGKHKRDWRRYGKRRRLNKLTKKIGDSGKIYITGQSDDYMRDLEDRAKDFWKDKPSVLAIDGGDETIATVSTMIDKHKPEGEEDPLIALFKGGSFMQLQKRIGIGNSYKLLDNILRCPDADELPIVGLEMMTVKDDSDHEHICFSAGVGIINEFLESVYKHKRLGNLGVAWTIARVAYSRLFDTSYNDQFSKTQRMNVKSVGHKGEFEKEDDWLLVLAQSISTLGVPKRLPQPRLFRHAEAPDRFHAVASTASFNNIVDYFWPIWYGKQPHRYDYETQKAVPVLDLDRQSRELIVQSEEPFLYQFNGGMEIEGKPAMTRELSLKSGKVQKFIKDDFGKYHRPIIPGIREDNQDTQIYSIDDVRKVR